MAFDEQRPPPDWLGDVSAGVDAWTKRASTPETSPRSEVAQGRAGQPLPVVAEGALAHPSAVVEEGALAHPPAVVEEGALAHPPAVVEEGALAPVSKPPPEDTATRAPEADAESVARKILLDQLTGQARSRRELADRLAKKNVPEEIAGRLLDRFEEVGLVDDEAFARSWIASRRSVGSGGGKGLARRALAQELRRKGVDDEVAREALDEIDPADEEAAARALVRKKLGSLARVDDATATRRLVGMLARKGYGSGMSFAVVRDELATSGRGG